MPITSPPQGVADLTPAEVARYLGEIRPGELGWWFTVWGGLGGRNREDDPDPIDVGSGPVPRYAVRLVAYELALRTGGRDLTAGEVARESGLHESTVVRALQVLGRVLGGRV